MGTACVWGPRGVSECGAVPRDAPVEVGSRAGGVRSAAPQRRGYPWSPRRHDQQQSSLARRPGWRAAACWGSAEWRALCVLRRLKSGMSLACCRPMPLQATRWAPGLRCC
eukprot:353531-Chlamydomonas_euryale.AAC.2